MTRNLLEHPITEQEVCNLLIELYNEFCDQGGIGSLQPYIIDRLLTVVKRDFNHWDYNPDFSEFVENNNVRVVEKEVEEGREAPLHE